MREVPVDRRGAPAIQMDAQTEPHTVFSGTHVVQPCWWIVSPISKPGMSLPPGLSSFTVIVFFELKS
jgi:hypothetical protein